MRFLEVCLSGCIAASLVGCQEDSGPPSDGTEVPLHTPLFPNSEVFVAVRPQAGHRSFSPPFVPDVGPFGGPVMFGNSHLSVGSPMGDLWDVVLGNNWNLDITTKILESIWNACGDRCCYSNIDLTHSSYQIHSTALERAVSSQSGFAEAAPVGDSLFNPFERVFCFYNPNFDAEKWSPYSGSVCIDIIKDQFRPNYNRRGHSENAFIIYGVFPTLAKAQTNEQRIVNEEIGRAVRELSKFILECIYTYNTRIYMRNRGLPPIEAIRLAPLDPSSANAAIGALEFTDTASENVETGAEDISVGEGYEDDVVAKREATLYMIDGLSLAYRRIQGNLERSKEGNQQVELADGNSSASKNNEARRSIRETKGVDHRSGAAAGRTAGKGTRPVENSGACGRGVRGHFEPKTSPGNHKELPRTVAMNQFRNGGVLYQPRLKSPLPSLYFTYDYNVNFLQCIKQLEWDILGATSSRVGRV